MGIIIVHVRDCSTFIIRWVIRKILTMIEFPADSEGINFYLNLQILVIFDNILTFLC